MHTASYLALATYMLTYFLNQAHANLWLMCTWFLEIDFVCDMCMCVYVSTPRLLMCMFANITAKDEINCMVGIILCYYSWTLVVYCGIVKLM